jgi:hypothetical protein
MRERYTLEREVRPIGFPFPESGWQRFIETVTCAAWNLVQDGVWQAEMSDPDAPLVKSKPIKVTVRFYAGTTRSIALVFGGVHGDEDEGVKTANAVRAKLDAAYSAKPAKRARFGIALIENLRASRDSLDTASANQRFIGSIEPNRNFPLPGEGMKAALARKARLGFELVDPDVRRFPDTSPRLPAHFTPKKGNSGASTAVLPENRVLMKLIACMKPERAVSLHAHSSNKRGNGPGIFVDPRGGFDTDLDAPLTAEGREDDLLANKLLKAAVKALPGSGLKAAEQKLALAGNQVGSKEYAGETVHYSYGAPKARGTSFGMWGPAPITGQGPENRPGMQTITLELPKWLGDKKTAPLVGKLADVWAKAIVTEFLEVP